MTLILEYFTEQKMKILYSHFRMRWMKEDGTRIHKHETFPILIIIETIQSGERKKNI